MKKTTKNRTQTAQDNVPIGQRLKSCRKMRGLTQAQLTDAICELAGNADKIRNEKQVGYIENGKRKLSAELAHLYAKVLRVRVEYLLGIDDFMTEEDRFLGETDRFLKKLNRFASLFDLTERLISETGYSFSAENVFLEDHPMVGGRDVSEYLLVPYIDRSIAGKDHGTSGRYLLRDGEAAAWCSDLEYKHLVDDIFHYAKSRVERLIDFQNDKRDSYDTYRTLYGHRSSGTDDDADTGFEQEDTTTNG